jgi:hypothetical protein
VVVGRDRGRCRTAVRGCGGSFSVMGVLGAMFPGRKITDEAAEDGDAQPWLLGPIDLDRGVVQVHRAALPVEEEPSDAE